VPLACERAWTAAMDKPSAAGSVGSQVFFPLAIYHHDFIGMRTLKRFGDELRQVAEHLARHPLSRLSEYRAG